MITDSFKDSNAKLLESGIRIVKIKTSSNKKNSNKKHYS